MTDNNLQANDTAQDTASPLEKQASKPALSRHPKAVKARAEAKKAALERGQAKEGGEGVVSPPRRRRHIDPVTKKILAQKAFASAMRLSKIMELESAKRKAEQAESARIALEAHSVALQAIDPPIPSFVPLPVEESPWKDGSRRAAIYGRPVNPRLLMIVFEDESHGRLVIAPRDKVKFSLGGEVWVKPLAGKDIYILCGVYNRFGVRVVS